MAKHSKRNRRRMHQGGMCGGFTVIPHVPIALQRRLSQAPTLSADAYERLRYLEYAQRTSVREASIAFQVPIPTIYRWRQRFRPDDLTSLECRSRRPKTTRKYQWTAAQEQAVLARRQAHPRMGKRPLQVLLGRQGIHLSASMIGRILGSLKRRQLLREPHAVRVRQAKPVRPYATKVPKDKRQPTDPGALIQLDTMHLRPLPGVTRYQFTAIDVVTRCAVVGVRATASSGTATDFLEELVDRMPFPVAAIQVDGGSEFMKHFELACKARAIDLWVLPPRSPKLNGRVERLNGTSRREFWECYDGDLDLPSVQAALQAWETFYNTERPHQALAYETPSAHLRSKKFSDVSN
jgi:putative transposase